MDGWRTIREHKGNRPATRAFRGRKLMWMREGVDWKTNMLNLVTTSLHQDGFPWEAPQGCYSAASMNRLGRDTQMCVHITKRQEYIEPNIRFSFPPCLHITGVQMSPQSEERGTLMSVCVLVCTYVYLYMLMLFCKCDVWDMQYIYCSCV